MRGHITASALVLDSTLTQVALIDHIGLSAWLNPGGHYEGSGTVRGTALREVGEETGIFDVEVLAFPNGDCLIDVDSHGYPARPSKGEGAHRHHDFMYVLKTKPGVVFVAQEEEVNGVKWLPLEEYAKLPRLRYQRIANKLQLFLKQWRAA
jgi:8-oxo-dGTP pyrophosphatase MutT (NUDIX family)